jgi:hypothetical protein
LERDEKGRAGRRGTSGSEITLANFIILHRAGSTFILNLCSCSLF